MKKILLLIGLPLLFLVSCNDDNKTSNTTNDNNPTTSEVTNESSQEENNKSNDKSPDEKSDSSESSETPSTNEPSQGNIENGGGYKDDSGDEWIYLG